MPPRLQPYNTEQVEYGTFNWLRREIGAKIGYKADHNLLGNIERRHVDSVIESGVQQFISSAWPTIPQNPSGPPPEGREPSDAGHVESNKEAKRRPPHRWSFMQRFATIATVVDQSAYDLPDDFGSWIGEPTTAVGGGRISIVREAQIRQLLSSEGLTGQPNYAALRKTSVGGVTKQASEIVIYPIPDTVQDIIVEYMPNTVTLTDDAQYPPGGLEHAETVLSYCFYTLAQRTSKGIQEAAMYVQDRLTASIAIDKESGAPTSEGVWVDDDGRFNMASLSRFIGRHIGAGPNPSAWTHQQEQLIAEALRRGRRRVYNPPLIRDERYPHDWSFLRPLTDIVTIPGIYEYDLPSDFAQMYGPMTHSTDQSTLFPAIRYVGEVQIRQLIQREETSARPERAAVRVKPHDDDVGTQYELLLWPIPDQNYRLTYRYRVNPDTQKGDTLPALTTKFELHGGDRYWEVYLEAALYSADELMEVRNSKHGERFMRALEAGVGQDRLTHSPDYMGYNSDPASERDGFRADIHDWDENIVTYNGIEY